MRYLLILNGAVFAMAATIGTVLCVVCLMYGVNLDTTPSVMREMPALMAATATFCALAVVTGIGFWGLLRTRPWRWAGEAGAAIGVAASSIYLYGLFTV
ncbi:MAG: hypothetical protein ACT4QA_02735 [Panacagrimonas sp.]